MAAPGITHDLDSQAVTDLHALFAKQKSAFRRAGAPDLAKRQEHLAALAGMVVKNRHRIQEAMKADFCVHPDQVTDMTEVLAVAGQAMYVHDNLSQWIQPEIRDTDPTLYGSARAELRYEPKGVLGIIAPWNFPFLLSLGPLVDMLGAGNRVIIKPSENAPASSHLLRELVAETFEEDHVAVVEGGLRVSQEFTTLTWDHLLYTGNTAVGREIAVAAARNLVPVTLELGGKNPALVHSDSVNSETVRQILGNKLVKSGQVCIAPDYCLVPRDKLDDFVVLANEFMASVAPYTNSEANVGIVNERHFDRLVALRDEASARGCTVIDLEPGVEESKSSRQLAASLVLDPPDDLGLMREEIFGPILPIKPYDSIDEAIDYVNDGGSPLGLYVFAKDTDIAEQVLSRTVSGGACINTCAVQGVLPALGFGGAGPSGYGIHRGVEGFKEFSHARGVVVRGPAESDLISSFFPPYVVAKALVTEAFKAIEGQTD